MICTKIRGPPSFIDAPLNTASRLCSSISNGKIAICCCLSFSLFFAHTCSFVMKYCTVNEAPGQFVHAIGKYFLPQRWRGTSSKIIVVKFSGESVFYLEYKNWKNFIHFQNSCLRMLKTLQIVLFHYLDLKMSFNYYNFGNNFIGMSLV